MQNQRAVFEIISTLVMAAVAVVMLGFYLADRGRSVGAPLSAQPAYVEDWAAENRLGIRIGPDNAPIVITEFMDFTCPFCRQLVPVIDSLLDEYSGRLAVVFHHFPL